MELTYTMKGDYLLPNLSVPETPMLGKYGMLRRSFLRKQKKAIYTGLMLSGKLDAHLTEIDQQAADMMENLTAQMAQTQGVTETLKATDQMKWVQRMNNIRSAAEEVVMTELIYS